MTGEETAALDIAAAMAAAGIPVFVAYPDPEGKTPSGRATGYTLPTGWQTTAANPDYVKAWKPGLALCAVMGHGLDLVDIDPRHGGQAQALNGAMPHVYGMAATPSGGYHFFVKSLGVRSRDNVLPGIDVKAGLPGDKAGLGCAFIAPTVRKSKVSGDLAAYRWVAAPDLEGLTADDTSGSKLADLIRQGRDPGQLFDQPGGHSDAWTDPKIEELLREGIPEGQAQQPILRDLVAQLNGQGLGRSAIRSIWWTVVAKTTLTDPAWPWAEADFTDMYESAVRKFGAPQRAAPGGHVDVGDPAGLLDDVHAFICRFVAFPSQAAAHAVTLWAAHCHAPDSFESTPRIALLSPEPGSGKTRTLEVVELLTPRPMHALNASVAAIFRSIEKARPTLLIDECDAIFTKRGKDDTNEDLRAMLNAGHRKGASIPRCTGAQHDVTLFPVYAAVALAGLGDLPATLMTRSVVIRMRRRAPGETVEPFRIRPATADATPLYDRLAAWMGQVAPVLADTIPVMPAGITDRPADVWEPLLAVADAAGGEWPRRARAACLELAAAAETGEASLGVRLLTDLAEIFGDADKLSTATILDRLIGLDEAPWGDLRGKPIDARGLARRLSAYDIRSVNVRVGDATPKGYRAEDLHDAWSRYVPGYRGSATSATTPQPQVSDPLSVADDESVADTSATLHDSATDSGPLTCTVPHVADVADLREPGTDTCRICGEPLDPVLVGLGYTDHGEAGS